MRPQYVQEGRDPHDRVTMELPLPASDPYEVKVSYKPILLAAKAALGERKEAVAWLLLMQWAGMPIGIGE